MATLPGLPVETALRKIVLENYITLRSTVQYKYGAIELMVTHRVEKRY
jgi:hypothetical protein